ncbi:hypothetical protein [Caulobacter sp. NIBR1757]|uniref:hypothetical protein n=1 Tax=Caulobacter sp. NIBR1757 TaxID=3016000 RepID=UPI0022F0A0EC|nr:hypothetical protein [Caulobacter sp. NIBR1757]WGM39120.1 hypothetical protein AMEJIAPC_02033 [Caulobacter sp. NIBR1757]
MRIAFLAAGLLLVASPVFAQAGAGAPLADPAAPKKKAMDDPNRIVCTREHVVGSNRPQKVCMTVAQRQRLKDDADRLTDPGNRSAGTAEDFKGQQPGG